MIVVRRLSTILVDDRRLVDQRAVTIGVSVDLLDLLVQNFELPERLVTWAAALAQWRFQAIVENQLDGRAERMALRPDGDQAQRLPQLLEVLFRRRPAKISAVLAPKIAEVFYLDFVV